MVFADPTRAGTNEWGLCDVMGRASVPRIRRDRREKRLVKPATWPMTPPQNELDHLFPDRAADGLMLKEQPSP